MTETPHPTRRLHRGWFARLFVLIRFATLNVGDVRVLYDVLHLMAPKSAGGRGVVFLALQECLDREPLLDELERRGLKVARFTGKGRQATVVVWSPAEATMIRSWAALGTPAGDYGPGAGPDRLPAKWLVGATFRHHDTGRRIHFGSIHLHASQQHRRRLDAALAHVARWLTYCLRMVGIVIVAGDLNATPTSRLIATIRAAGWRSSHDALGALPTHGRRVIDYVWLRASLVARFYRHFTVRTASDHRALIADVAVRPTRRARRRLTQEDHRP